MTKERQSLYCPTCTEPTREAHTYDDGFTLDDRPCRRVFYTCGIACAMREIQETLELDYTSRKRAVYQENRNNGISAVELRRMRLLTGLTLHRAARLLGIGSTKLSQWENAKRPIPPEDYERAREAYRKAYRERKAEKREVSQDYQTGQKDNRKNHRAV